MLVRIWNIAVMHVLRAVMIVFITLNSLLNRVRMSHENGIVTRGRVRMVDQPLLPANTFFRAGAEFPCRLRHATVSLLDDAAMTVRGASIKFADADDASPLDILMNNGAGAPFWNMWTFAQFMWARARGGRAHLIPYFKRNPRCFINVVGALRLDPSSFSQLYYYSETPLRFVADDGVERYIKFRLIPGDRGAETGIPPIDALQHPWFQEPKPGETRPPNYLKDEYRQRLEQGPVQYHLQAQLHAWDEGDRREVVLSSLYPWDEASHPWLDIAEVSIESALSRDDGNNCLFGLNHLPDCIQRIPPRSIDDPPSLEFLRAAGSWPRRARLLSYRLFGRTPPIPQQRAVVAYPDETASRVSTSDIYLVAGLPQHDDAIRHDDRQRLLEQARGQYQWDRDPGMPPFVRELPPQEAFDEHISRRMAFDVARSFISFVLANFEERLTKARGLRAYNLLYAFRRHLPEGAKRYRSDVEFARLRLDGINPGVIRRCTRLPANFPVTDADVAGLLDAGDSLASACAAGRVYLCDYAVLDGIALVPGRYACVPMALFYCGVTGTLMPLAVQLGQSPDAGPVFTPNDDQGLWQLVMTYVRCANAQMHEASTHLLHTHLVAEVFAVAMHRQLSPAHPIHKLLSPHFQFTLAINTAARQKMLAPGGPIDSTMAVGRTGALALIGKVWSQQWSFSDYDLAADFAARGVDDRGLLPNYHYRDDAMQVWPAIESFVAEVLGLFYRSDADVAADEELAGWFRELVSSEGGAVRGLPGQSGQDRFTTIEQVVTTVARLVYIGSAGHGAVNNGQYDQFGYIPSTPGALYQPAPRDRAPRTEADLVKALPNFHAADIQIGMVHLLSLRPEVTLGSYEPDFFAGTPAVMPMVERFQHRLAEISRQIRVRNEALAVPYHYLDPIQIPRSINA